MALIAQLVEHRTSNAKVTGYVRFPLLVFFQASFFGPGYSSLKASLDFIYDATEGRQQMRMTDSLIIDYFFRYFLLVVAVYAHSKNKEYLVCANVSERIIVRVSSLLYSYQQNCFILCDLFSMVEEKHC